MTNTTMNTGAAPQQGTFDGDSEETRKAFREYDAEYPVTHRSHWQIWRDAIAYAHKTALATPTPQADAAIAAGGAQEPNDDYEVDHGTHIERVPFYNSDADDVESDGRLPNIARTKEGKRLYSMAYARGRAREKLNASGKLKAISRHVQTAEPTRREMCLMLPEGGHVNLFWPDELTADSALMLSKMFATVMQAFARAAAAKPDASFAASNGEQA